MPATRVEGDWPLLVGLIIGRLLRLPFLNCNIFLHVFFHDQKKKKKKLRFPFAFIISEFFLIRI